ncbi:MAG: restriction endonuclease [Methylococcales bacterium]|nr:restriction endonuclease [Methylococcales bacterium]
MTPLEFATLVNFPLVQIIGDLKKLGCKINKDEHLDELLLNELIEIYNKRTIQRDHLKAKRDEINTKNQLVEIELEKKRKEEREKLSLLKQLHRQQEEEKKELYRQQELEKKVLLQTSIKNAVYNLLQDEEIIEMGINFINALSESYYLDCIYIAYIESIIDIESCGFISDLLLIDKQERNSLIKQNEGNLSTTLLEEINYYVIEKLVIFAEYLSDKTGRNDLGENVFITYLIIYNIVIEQVGSVWGNLHKHNFNDVENLELDQLIIRYALIDNIIHTDKLNIGKLTYYLIKNNKFENNKNYIDCINIVIPKVNNIIKVINKQNFINKLKTTVNSELWYSIDDVDLMSGIEFEQFISNLFLKMGYESNITKATGDQGIDVIASKNGIKIGIQAKCYSGSVSNSAIQEAVAGINHYRLDKAIVITNSYFTDSAKELAQSNSVILWDRIILKEKIDTILNISN